MNSERAFTTHFIKWLKHFRNESIAFEVKVSKGKSLPFDAVKPHQRTALLAANHTKIVHKIADDGHQKPFDGFILARVPAYVVIYFIRKGNKQFYLVDIDEWVQYESDSPKKSITEEGLQTIGIICNL